VRTHCTQLPPLQTGAADGQSELARHATHVPSVPQSLPAWVAQSTLPTHWTQVDSLVLHTGVAPAHSELDVHPGMQVKARGLQIGLAMPQSELSRHATQRPVAAKHRGAPAGQSESTAHATHWAVVGSQTLFAPVQGVVALHPTQTFASGSQVGALRGHTVAALAVVQAGWHWWSPGQHDGEAFGQSEFAAHAAH
jgi:hypothetical protein